MVCFLWERRLHKSRWCYGYGFDENFQLTIAMKGDDVLDLRSVDADQVKPDSYKLVQPVIDKQPKPWVNLQWLYDWIN